MLPGVPAYEEHTCMAVVLLVKVAWTALGTLLGGLAVAQLRMLQLQLAGLLSQGACGASAVAAAACLLVKLQHNGRCAA